MALTAAQKTTLKNDIANNANTVVIGGTTFQIKNIGVDDRSQEAAQKVADWYNLTASPGFTIWKKLVPLADIAKKLNGTELAGLTSLNHTRLQTVVALINAASGLDASLADQRQFFDDIFSGSGGATTRASLLVLWKKLATNAEKLTNFSSGTGSDASPATTAAEIGMNFQLSTGDIFDAWSA